MRLPPRHWVPWTRILTLLSALLVACGSVVTGGPPAVTAPRAQPGLERPATSPAPTAPLATPGMPPASAPAPPPDPITRPTPVTPAAVRSVLLAPATVVLVWSSADAATPLQTPIAAAMDRHGVLYVVDAADAAIHAFDRDGRPIARWGGEGGAAGQFRFQLVGPLPGRRPRRLRRDRRGRRRGDR